jgi:pimeloyl-ACP methyl ester carboxylesterase
MYIEKVKIVKTNSISLAGFPRMLKKILKPLLITMLSIVVFAMVIETYRKYQNEQHYPAPGDLLHVQTHQMHIWCEGQGEPTVVLDAGAGLFSIGWRWVMPALSPSTRVCAFDRSGVGWSERGLPPYDGITAANELNELLDRADIEKPFIYVGHSLGGNMGMIYHHQYPGDLSALVMLEPADPAIFLQEIGEEREEPVVRGAAIPECGMRCWIGSVASKLGIIDIALEQIDAVNDPLFHTRALAEFKARTNRTESQMYLLQRGRYMTEIMFQARDTRSFQDLPVAIFHAENSGELLGDHANEKELLDDRENMRLAYQRMLGRSSQPLGLTRIDNANHATMIMHREPAEAVTGRILEILDQVQNR